jgi:predicted glycosyltransferase
MRRSTNDRESAGDEIDAADDQALLPPLPRVLFYSHDGYGLGHIQRTLAIAASLARHRPQVSMLALTTAIRADSHRLPPSFDYVRIPSNSAQNVLHPGGIRSANSDSSKRILAIREAVIGATASAYRPQMMIVDDMPAGRNRELVRALSLLRHAVSDVELVLTLKDIIDDPAKLRAYWQTSGAYQLVEETYDRVLVFGDRRIGDPVTDLEFPPSVAAKTTFCGYIYDPTDTGGAESVQARLGLSGIDRPLIVVTVGGGADGAPIVRAYLEALRGRLLPPVASFVTTGPLLAGERRDELDRLAAGLPDLTIVPYAPDLRAYLEAADLVVSMGGYNTICEVVGLGKRALIVPRERWHEQVIRAERLAEYGVISVLRLRDLSPESLARAIASLLGSSPPPHDLDFGGFERAGAILAAALDR